MLEQLIDQLAAKEFRLAVARAKHPLLDAFATSGLTVRIGYGNFFPNVEVAVKWMRRTAGERVNNGVAPMRELEHASRLESDL
jgi:hypothetical protein